MATETTIDAPPTLQQAFADAKAEHSASAEHATAASARTEPETTSATNTPDSAASSATPSGDSDLISDAEYQALASQHPDDPVALRKALQGVFTKKTQALAEQRRAIEPYAEVLEAFEQDPHGTIRALARQHGLTIAEATQAVADATQTSAVDDGVAAFKAALGPDLDFLADRLAPAAKAMAEAVARQLIDERVAPLAEQQDTLLTRAATEQTNAIMQTFTQKRPDWSQHEAKMMEIGSKLQPNGMDEIEYLDTLYLLATKDTAQGDAVKRTVERMVRGAQEAEGQTRRVPESQVTRTTTKPLTFREAYEEAKRDVASGAAVR